MAGDPYQHVTAGTPFRPSSRVWNDMLDTSRAFKARRFGQKGTAPNLPSPTSVLLRVVNGSAQTLPRGAILGIEGPAFPPAGEDPPVGDDRLAVTIVAPREQDVDTFVILETPLVEDPGAVGRAVLVGATWVRVLVDHESHRFARAIAGNSSYLTTAPGGPAKILWREEGTGLRWAIVLLGGDHVQVIVGKTDTPSSKGGAVSVNVYDNEEEDLGYNIGAENLFADLDANKWVIAVLIGTKWYLVAGECA